MSTQTATLKAVPQEPAEPAQEATHDLVPAPETAVQPANPSKKERIRKASDRRRRRRPARHRILVWLGLLDGRPLFRCRPMTPM